ncbi:ribonuclease P [Halolamina sp. CBA1230]|uniref:RNase P subunit p30 family protein n=1 Tax=Halolamina sp. CBA1230 TaxID=1853690 RepID=UPI0009A1675B|nr:RNase P subunit p30 family protein [Halolamina sp. CBA1230]QKY18945.1 ribonuclease P [Halolamina sp. CBA1230]
MSDGSGDGEVGNESDDEFGPYEAVYAHPEGDSTVARQVKTAAEYGFEGVVVRTREAEYDPGTLAERHGIDVVRGVEIDAEDPQGASGAVGNHRGDCTVLLVRGGTDALNRFAVEQNRVDVLTRPFDGEGDVNHVLVKAAIDHDVRIEFDLGAVLRDDGGTRVRRLRKLRKLRELVEYFDAPYVVSATPTSHLRLRAPRELAAVGEQIGLGAEAVRDGLAEWGRMAARNRERTSDSFISPGVRRGRHEE